jgi:hypothetical protein
MVREPLTHPRPLPPRQVTLVDLLDRLLGIGVVVRGQITLAAADIDLVDLDLAILLAAVDKAASR